MSDAGEESVLQRAIEFHQGGKFAEAETLYRKILASNPDQVDAIHFLGVLAGQFNNHDAAIAMIRRALSLRPGDVEARFNLATNLAAGGKVDEAIGEFKTVLGERTDDADAHFLISDLLRRTGKKDEAVGHLHRTLALREANPDAHNNLGNLLQEQGKLDEAIRHFERSLTLRPSHADTMNNLGNALRQKGELDKAFAMLQRAAALSPKSPQIRTNVGNVLRDRGEYDAAIGEYRKALKDGPEYPEAWNNMGVALREAGRLDEAVAAHQRAQTLRPEYVEARYAEAWALLMGGQFDEGWRAYESRAQGPGGWGRFENRWMREPLNGRRVLLHAEQGFGDTIQFARYAGELTKLGGRVILECQRELAVLFAGLAGIEGLVARGDAIPAFDVHCPLMSVPFLLRTKLETIPSSVPYIEADPISVARWAGRLKEKTGRRVGLVWAGRNNYRNDRNRSMRLADLAPLAKVEGITFHSVQTGDAGGETANAPEGFAVIDHRDELSDFSDTAALIANLDLVISVDTAVAHLAGAMGKEVWTLLAFAPDWRWMLARADSPWYPTMRLFRQSKPGDWVGVIGSVAEELSRR